MKDTLPKNSAYPTKIYFADECYRIKFKENFYCYGETDGNKKTITIKSGMSRRATMATVIHELLHVIEFEVPLNIKHKTIYKLEQAIVELILDNFV